MRDRILESRIRSSAHNLLLLGPRQVGKSTLLKRLKPDITIDLSDETLFLAHARDPGLLKREIAAVNADAGTSPKSILIDEVQRLPAILNTVQHIGDQFPDRFRFLLTGSSARKLKRGGANLLPGRIILEHLDPFAVSEVEDVFDLDRALRLGMLPGVYLGGEEASAVLETYATVYLKEEIHAEAHAQDIGAFARFLDIVAVISGQWLNYSKLASDTEIPKETIRRFMGLLEDTLVAFRIPPFQGRSPVRRRLTQRDKIILFDVGVRNALLGLHRHPPTADQIGSIFEQWFILQAIYLNRALKKGWRISSYRTDAGAEVDLVIERPDGVLGIEIKAGKRTAFTDTSGLMSLSSLLDRKDHFEPWIVTTGETRQKFDNGVEVYPYLEALRCLASHD